MMMVIIIIIIMMMIIFQDVIVPLPVISRRAAVKGIEVVRWLYVVMCVVCACIYESVFPPYTNEVHGHI